MSEQREFPKCKYIFLWGGLKKNAGGMTRAMLKRAELFITEGLDVTILLAARGVEQLDNVEYYTGLEAYSHVDLSHYVAVEEYLGRVCSDPSVNDTKAIDVDNLPREEVNDQVVYYKDGFVYAKELPSEAVHKRRILYYDTNGNKTADAVYWNGLLNRVSTENGEDKEIRCFAPNGFCFMRLTEKTVNGKTDIAKVMLFNQIDKTVTTFPSKNHLTQYFFHHYIGSLQEKEIVVFHDPFLDFNPGFAQMKWEDKTIYRIGVNHGCGIGGDKQWYNNLNPRVRDMIETKYTPDVEGYICLTKQCAEDYSKRLGKRNIIFQVPNNVSYPESVKPYEDRDQMRVVFIGRLANQKQLHHLIAAWDKVEKELPQAHLHIFGTGDKEQSLKEQIKKLNLQTVFMEGFTNRVNEEYQDAALCVNCSDFEGFSLSLLESLSNGCPVVTYDFKYGPRDIIVDGLNGFMTPYNDIDKLAEAVIETLKLSTEYRAQMSLEARKSVYPYRSSVYRENWLNMIEQIREQHPYRTQISTAVARCDSYKVIPENREMECELTMDITGDIPECAYGMEVLSIRLYNETKTDFTEEKLEYTVSREGNKHVYHAVCKAALGSKISMCLVWNNSYVEKAIEI